MFSDSFSRHLEEDELLRCLCWADDVYLLAGSRDDLATMMNDFINHMTTWGLEIQVDGPCWCTTGILTSTPTPTSTDTATATATAIPADLSDIMHVRGHDLRMTPREPGIKVLGSHISFTGSCAPECKARGAAAWKNFFKHRPMLCHREASIKQKLHLLHVVIRPCLLWAVCTLTLTAAFLKSLDVLQLSMVSIFSRRGRNPDEGWLDWFVNTRREARTLIKDEGYRTWSNDALFAYCMWAGHAARLPHERYAALAHQHADLTWWKQRQALI